MRPRTIIGLRLLSLLALPLAAAAQDMPPIGSLPGGHRPVTDPVTLSTEPAHADAAVDTSAIPPATVAVPVDMPVLVLRDLRFEGGDGLPLDRLAPVYAPSLGRKVSLADLEWLRHAMTRVLVDAGYLNSGVVLAPEQVVRDGVVVFRVIAGRLSEVRVSGNGRLYAGYISRRLNPYPERPFNRNDLQQRFQLLLDDPLIDKMDARLMPGTGPGTAVLEVAVTPAESYDVYLRTDNYRPPSTGAERAYLGGELRNLTGFGDALRFHLGRGFEGQGSEGSVEWSVPVNARDTRAFARWDRTDAALIEASVRSLDIESETTRVELGISHPLIRSPERSLVLGLLGSRSENTTTLLGRPFSFSPGAVAGESRVSAVRLFQEYTERRGRDAFALRSVFSLGVDAFDATIHDTERPDSDFFAWLGQGEYVRRLSDTGTQLLLRGGMQLAGDSLLPLERFAIGGVTSVRGYRENELVGDSGLAASAELRHPLWRGRLLAKQSLLQGSLYADYGTVWDHGRRDERQDIYAIGIGAILTLAERLRAELYLAHALTEPVAHPDHDLQDDGVHFSIQIDY